MALIFNGKFHASVHVQNANKAKFSSDQADVILLFKTAAFFCL